MDDPVAVVRAFIADYFRWTTAAHERDTRGRRTAAAQLASMEVAEREYAALLAKFCRPGFVGQPIAYGIPPLHDPEREVVVSGKPRGDRGLVKTRKVYDVGGVEMVQDYEYRLSRSDGRWYLESVMCVVDGGRYESL